MRTATPPPVSDFVRTPDAGRVAFRVRVGVTGHRRLGDETAVADAVRRLLQRMRTMLPETDVTPVAFSFVSALAEGADRVVVATGHEALDGSELQLEAVLPLEPQDYEEDFGDEASVAEFRQLLDGAASVVRVPAAGSREEAYERAGRYVVDRCDVLIAVWDGHPARGRGGTAETVSYAQDVGVPVIVVSPGDGAASATRWPGDDRFAGLRHAWQRIDEYNRVSFDDPRVAALRAAEEGAMADLSAQSPIHWSIAAAAEWGVPHMVRADHLAMQYQRRYNRLGESLFGASALAVTAVAAQVVFAPDHPVWAIVEVALMLVLLAGVAVGRRARIHDQWVAYRSLAEAFRAGTFITLTVVDDHPTDEGSSEDQLGQRWFQRAFSEAWRVRPHIEVPAAHAPELGRLLAEGWLARQIDYHRRAVTRFERGHTGMTRGVVILFAASLVIGLLHVNKVGEHGPAQHPLAFLAIALPGFGAALTGIRDQRQFRLHAERSTRTAARLERVRRVLAIETSIESIRRLALDAQSIMAEENLDWSSVVEFQDVEIIL